MIGKILVPLDGSELSELVLGQVRRLLHGDDAQVVLARIVSEKDRERDPALVDVARLHVNRIRDALVGQGARAETLVVTGDPVEKLVETIRSTSPSLVVMATHGRTGLDRVLHGSVTEELVRRSPAPVLVANPRGLEPSELRFRRLLVPLDGSELGAAALGPGCDLARLHGAELVLFHAIPIVAGGGIDLPQVAYPMTVSEAHELLEKYRERCSGITVRTKVAMGSPSATILDAAREDGCDLIVLSTHGRTGFARVAFGSVAEAVVRRAECPILLAKPVTERAEAAS